MNDEFLGYYEKEMAFLRQMGGEFAAAHPQVAGKLAIEAARCEDPHVERLLEGFAFLAARIRKKVDDEYPEITDALLSVVYPHYQRPIPSMAIVQFIPTADATKVAGGHVIPRGVELTTPPVSGSTCRFRAAYPTTLWPVAVESASMALDRVTIARKPEGSKSLLRLGLRCTAPEGWASLEGFDSLRFYLDGDEPVPTSMHESLFNDLCEIWVRGKVAGGSEKTVVLPRDSVRAVGFEADESVLPYPNRSFPGYRLLQEYFGFPLKFLFFDLTGLSAVREARLDGPIEVLFFLKQPPGTAVVIRPDNFRLGCSPVVNLFEVGAEPIRLTRLKTTYPIVPKYGELLGHEVYSVDRVVSVGSYLESSVEFQPFYSVRHAEMGARRNAYWFASRRPSARDGDEGTEVDLSFTDPDFSPMSPSVEKITAHVTCTNRDLPAGLSFGGTNADFQLESDAPVGRVRLLTRPTRTLRPPLKKSAQWEVISLLALNHLSLIEDGQGAEAIRELLKVHDFGRSAVTHKMINGVVGVSYDRVPARIERVDRAGRRLGSPISLGMEVTVEFDEDAYAGSGAFLMASVLERFLGAYVTINSFTQMVARSKQREGIWKKWPPRCGDRTLL